jgi:hypothetical protein
MPITKEARRRMRSLLLKIAAEKPPRVAQAAQALNSGIDRVFTNPLAKVLGAPFTAAGGIAGRALFGPKARFGPMKGHRLSPVAGGPGVGLEVIPEEMYNAIRTKQIPGKAFRGSVEGKPVFYARKYAPGGIVGFARRHPMMTAGLGALGYYMLKNPEKREGTYELARAIVPVPELPDRSIDPATTQIFSATPSAENPLTRQTWG